MTAYATRKDVYRYGFSRGALGNPGRQVASCLAATDTITLDAHGFETDDQVTFRAIEGGTLSAPLVAGTPYFAIRITDSAFKLAATAGGAPIDLTVDGVSMQVATALPFDELLEAYSRFVDGVLVGHVVPLTAPYPIQVVVIVAELVAKKLQLIAGQASDSMKETELGAKAQLERWAAGIPTREAVATVSANKAVSQPAGALADQRGWGSGSLP